MLRGLLGVVVVGVVVLTVLAGLALGTRSLDSVLPPAWAKALAELGPAADPVADTPTAFLDRGPAGLFATGPIAAAKGNQPVFIADVITDYSTQVADDRPAEITTIRPILGCLLTPPMQGSVVGHVSAGQSGLGLALSTYNDTDLAAAVQTLVDGYRETGQAEVPSIQPHAFQAYDVAVTETRAPVYLVLESGAGNRMWNIHLAPGARIERVVLLGGDQAGVANLDPVVPVEVILNDGLAACAIRPAHTTGQGGATGTEAEVAAYDQWLRDTFNLASGASRAGFDGGTISVVGPVPGAEDPKAVFAPLAESDIRTTQDSFFEIRDQVAAGDGFSDRVKAIATGFAFGDLTTLRQGVRF